ncbi:hypothetical protein C0Q70_07132 [Pomacea canaliculata]|uniref:TBCC domain-containing protein 1 n=1 Tax=Pomacea canaliculata TaxID=400727 RepID=A0A2T7PE68_POMCA|nr:hypothetical protein C0Q70_07132 [Pomacea canaliculata]
MSRTGVDLWVKAEPFSYGALPVAPHPRLNFSNIKKILIYAKSKGSAGFPKLSYSVWKHIACHKMQLTEDLAWVYFETCYFLTTDMLAIERAERVKSIGDCKTPEEGVLQRAKYSIDTLKFVLYLYIQLLYKVSLRASLLAGDEWPTQTMSLDLDGRSTPRSSKSLDDHSHLVFIQSNIAEIIELLSEQDASKSGSISENSTVHGSLSLSAVEALSFIITGCIEKSVEKKTIMPLQDIAVLQSIQYYSGYSKATKTFSLRQFLIWLKDNLIMNPYSVSACIALGTRLSWPFGGEGERDATTVSTSTKRGKIATNAQIVPKEHVTGNKLIIMSQVSKQTIARSSGTLERSTIKIHRSHFSYIYLLSPLRSVTVEKCRNTTVVLGAIEAFVHISNCEGVTVICPCRSIMIRQVMDGCTQCTFYLLTSNRPLLLSGNKKLMLAPYNTYYSHLEEHMSYAGLTASVNLWDNPLCIGPDHSDETPAWELLPPADFGISVIPFQMDGPTKSIPGGLPGRYHRAVVQRQKQVDSWQRTVKEAGLNREQRREFQALVESRFHMWLAETGHKRELDSLAVPQQHHGQS